MVAKWRVCDNQQTNAAEDATQAKEEDDIGFKCGFTGSEQCHFIFQHLVLKFRQAEHFFE